MARFAIICGALSSLLVSACTSQLLFDINPGGCINPPHTYCTEDGQDSRWLDVRVYQLKKTIDPCKLDLEEFHPGKDPAAVLAALTDKDRLDAVKKVFPVQRNDPKRLPAWEIIKGTKALLIVALGRGRGKNSVRQVMIDKVPSTLPLYFSGYDICIGETCERRPQEQCP